MMLAGCPVPNSAVVELARILRHNGAGNLADRLDRAVADQVKLLALTFPERAVLLAALEDPPDTLTELRAVLLSDHRWRLAQGLD